MLLIPSALPPRLLKSSRRVKYTVSMSRVSFAPERGTDFTEKVTFKLVLKLKKKIVK